MKCVIDYQYRKYVVSKEDAFIIINILENAEEYVRSYAATPGRELSHHVWKDANIEVRSMELMPDELYRLAKLAGKPEEKK